MLLPVSIEKAFERNSTCVHGTNSGKLKIEGSFLFLNSTANTVRGEMLEAFSLKSGKRQIYILIVSV